MKRFIRTLAGKTIAFIACAVALCVFAASVAGMALLSAEDGIVYRLTEQELTAEMLVRGRMRADGYSLLRNELSGSPEGQGDYVYRITDGNGAVIAETKTFADADMTYALSYGVLRDGTGKLTGIIYHYDANAPTDENAEYYTVLLAPVEGSSAEIIFAQIASAIHIAYTLRYAVYGIAAASLLLSIVCFVALMAASGRRPDTEELYPGPLHKLPFDLLLCLCGVIGGALASVGHACLYSNLGDFAGILCVIGICLVGLNILLGLCMSAAGRIKQHTFLRQTVICRVMKLMWRILLGLWTLLKKLHSFNMSLLCGLPLIWKTGLAFCVLLLAELLTLAAFSEEPEVVGVLWLIGKSLLLPAVLYLALMLRRLQKSGKALAGGDLAYHTDTKGMFGDFRRHGDDLNRIADGMAIAVEARLKSERMKTELITNVSHDIKTPLTSIVNYAALIGGEPCENPKITEYSEVLVRQSEKLKRLIEDLVEASKASSGNLEVFPEPCDAAVFLSQVSGEYEEKLQKSELTLITKQPDKELRIMADGRRMWRIFDNLMNNICKYAQPGTRVYLTLAEQDGNAVISFKNTSKEPLDMSAEELTERFTRGDSSRNTEGNGLGLSIAKSMAELQGGSLTLSTDGDLFKAVLIFPLFC